MFPGMCPHRTKSAGGARVPMRGVRSSCEGGGLVQGGGLGGQARGTVRHTLGHQTWRMGKEVGPVIIV